LRAAADENRCPLIPIAGVFLDSLASNPPDWSNLDIAWGDRVAGVRAIASAMAELGCASANTSKEWQMSKKHSANGEADAESWCDGTKLLVKSEVDNPQEPPDDADAQASCEQVDGFDAILEQLSTVIGIDDVLFCRGLLKQILWMFLDNDGKFDNAQFGFVIAYLQSNKPRDRDEAAEKVLKIASQLLSMKYAERLWFAKTPQEIDIAERTYNKLVRTWLAQNQAREPERSRGASKVTVVTVNDRSQAIVGDVTQNAREPMPDKPASPASEKAVLPAAIPAAHKENPMSPASEGTVQPRTRTRPRKTDGQ
jgi:hypothetical protein